MNWLCISQHPAIITAILFGSVARGDSDTRSDIDILVICDDSTANLTEDIRDELAIKLHCDPLSVNVYIESQFRAMLCKGSLFAWHLRLEGRVLFNKLKSEELFSELQQYSSYREDISQYSILLSECKKSVEENGVNLFDLSLLFTVARNCCMLIAYRLGKPAFGRLSVFYVCEELVGNEIGLSEQDYINLSQWKLAYERGLKLQDALPSMSQAAMLMIKVKKLVCLGQRICFG